MSNTPLDFKSLASAIKDYINVQRNFRNAHITSTDVAVAIGISRTTLAKVMRTVMHVSFAEYLNKCRLQYAHHIIKTYKNDVDIEHLALMAGFLTTRKFKEKYRMMYPNDIIPKKKP